MTEKNPLETALRPMSLTLRGRIVELKRPMVMGILNLTPDSFYGGSRAEDSGAALKRAALMIEQGADILDIGACSTRPGSESASAAEERERLMEPLRLIRRKFPDVLLSVDTFRADIAKECIETAGVEIINDVSMAADPEMLPLVAKEGAGYVLTHSRGTPRTMDSLTDYGDDVTARVIEELAFKVSEARRAGVCNLIVDPGIGFAKTTEQNFELIAHLEDFGILECPILLGVSRKRLLREAAGCDTGDALAPTVALNAAGLMKGAAIIRVHDVAEGVQTVRTIEKLW